LGGDGELTVSFIKVIEAAAIGCDATAPL